jgi:hypothetical protein
MTRVPKQSPLRIPRGVTLTGESRKRAALWARRNPDLAARFNKLPAGARQNVLTAFTSPNARGVGKAVTQADQVRREATRARSQGRRERAKDPARIGGAWGYTAAHAPQRRKYRVWMVDDFDNVRAVHDYDDAPGTPSAAATTPTKSATRTTASSS